METVIVVALISTGGALGGVAISQISEFLRRRVEENRWYADFFLVRKVDALQNLYTALVNCYYTLNFYGNTPPKTLAEHQEKVLVKVEAYLRAMSMASLYLDSEAEQTLSKALGAFRQADIAIFLSLPDDQCPARKDSYPHNVRNLDWQKFLEAYESAKQYLKTVLNPYILRKIDRKMLNSSKNRWLNR